MNLLQIGIKKFLSIVVLLLLSLNTQAQDNEFAYRYEIEILNQDYLNVRIFKDENAKDLVELKFSNQVPNFYLKESIQNEISNFFIFYEDEKIEQKPIGDLYKIDQDFDYINYTVRFKNLEAKDFPIVQTFSENEYSLLNFANFLGKITDEEVVLEVLKDNQVLFQDTGTLNYFYATPVLINCQKQSFNNTNIKLEVFYTVKNKQFLNYVTEALEAFKFLGYEEKLEDKTMIFILDSKNENEGAISHKDHIVFNFNEIDKYKIQKTILHEMIHWVVPDLQSWLNESVAEFLSIKLLLKADLISEQRFLELIAQKMKKADRYKNYSLEELFNNKTDLSIKQNYQAMYSKGAVLAFALDLKLKELSNFDNSLEKYVLNGFSSNNEKLDLEFIQELINFENEYAIKNKPFKYNLFFNKLGILFEENKLTEVKAKQTVMLHKVNDTILIVDNGAVVQLQKNDVVLKLNGARDFLKIREKLMKKSEKSSCFVVLRDKKKKKIKISNKESLFKREKFNLSFFENRTEEQIENWRKYNGKSNRNI